MNTVEPFILLKHVNPVIRLRLLHAYISWRVDQWPNKVTLFDQWFIQRFSHLIPGTIEHAKSIATHCFYCNSPYSEDKLRIATHDHHYPKSEGFTDKHVICCFDCNNRKANVKPEVLLSKFKSAVAYKREMWGYSGKRLKFICGQFETIFNDRMNGTGPAIYFFKH